MAAYRRQGEMLEESPEKSWLARAARWLVGWVLLPLSFLVGLFVFGMHWGARHPDSQWISLTRWVAIHVFDQDPQLFADTLSGDGAEEQQD